MALEFFSIDIVMQSGTKISFVTVLDNYAKDIQRAMSNTETYPKLIEHGKGSFVLQPRLIETIETTEITDEIMKLSPKEQEEFNQRLFSRFRVNYK